MMLEKFPARELQSESDYKPVLDVLGQLRRREQHDRRSLKMKDLENELSQQGTTCNQLIAYFLYKLATYCSREDNALYFMQESILAMLILRKFLNEKGYQLTQMGSFMHKPQNGTEFCSNKTSNFSVLLENNNLGRFLLEYYPCYLSSVVR